MTGYSTLSSPRYRPGRRRSANTVTRPSGWAASHSPDAGAIGLQADFIILNAERERETCVYPPP